MKKIYYKNNGHHINIILFQGSSDSFFKMRKKYPHLFNSIDDVFVTYLQKDLDKVLAGDLILNYNKTNVFLMGDTPIMDNHLINKYCISLQKKGYNQCLYKASNNFSDFEIRDENRLNKCKCSSIDLFRNGCRCGGV